MKRIMGVYDVDPFYASRFAEFVNQKEQIPFTVMAFSSMEKLFSFSEQESLDLLLIGDGINLELLNEIKAAQIIRLSENREVIGGELPTVYKYQSADAVLREIISCYQIQPEQIPLFMTGLKSTVLGVYSPISRCGKTSFAFTLGQLLARESRTLYINLEEHSGLSKLTGTTYTGTLSDLLYYYRQGEYNHIRLGAVLYNWGGLDYVPPAVYAEDLAEVKGEELAGLIVRITADGSYDTILLDLGHLAKGAEPLLELCDIIYTPIKDDCVSSAKLEAWKDYLEQSGREHLWERVHLLNLPTLHTIHHAEAYLEQILWSELGDYVRDLLKSG